MLINQLNIQRFRGISGTLQLDLSAPLTVIYAPNGTGKTSICDAVEWLLCGSVGRLSSLEDESVRCKFGDDSLQTLVEVHIPQLNEPFSLKRILDNSSSKLLRKVGAGDYKQADDQDLLRLVVSAIPPSGNTAKSKIAWVRSTRFLESDSLRLLLDSDNESNETRKLIFSSLFGVAEYQRFESDLNRILNKLPALTTISREKKKIKDKIYEYEEAIKKLLSEIGEPHRDNALSLLEEIARKLGKNRSVEDVSQLYKDLEIEIIKELTLFSEKNNCLQYIRENFSNLLEKMKKSEDFEKFIESAEKEIKSLSERVREIKVDLDGKKSSLLKNESLIIELTEASSDLREGKAGWSYFLSLYNSPLIEIKDGDVRSSAISSYLEESAARIFSLKESLKLVDGCIEMLPNFLKKHDQIKGLNIELEALPFRRANKDEPPLPEQISEARAKLGVLMASREEVLGEIETILSFGTRYVEAHPDDSECPLCEHKHESNLVLQEKIRSRFSKLSTASKEEAALASKLEALTRDLSQENQLFNKSSELTSLKIKLEREIQDFEGKLIEAGILRSDLSRPEDLQKGVDGIRDQLQISIAKISKDTKPYEDARGAFHALEKECIRLQSLSSSLFDALDLSSELNFSVDNFVVSLEGFDSVLSLQGTLIRKKAEDERQEISKMSSDLVPLIDSQKIKLKNISEVKESLIVIRNVVNDFKRRWRTISRAEDINDAAIEAVAGGLAELKSTLDEVKLLFAKVGEYFEKIKDDEKKESEQGVHAKEIELAKIQLQEWQNQEDARSIITQEIELVKGEIRRFISQEIRPLSSTINTLYLRAQGNRFINSIEARPSKDGFLEWVAGLNENGASFEKMRSLSQGQRQDLALAIFLARARSLGGTFFLDEPLAHLDDLNRVALLDTLRVIVSEQRESNPLRLVLTTASNNLLRHLREKFSLVDGPDGNPALRIYTMSGNPKVGLDIPAAEVVSSPNKLSAV